MEFSKLNKEDGIKYIISFRRARKLYKNFIEKELEKYKLSQNEIEIIIYLNRYPLKNTAKDITKYSGLSKGMISRTIEQLISKNILEFEKDKDDKRIVRLKISKDSYKIISDLEGAGERFFETLSSGINDDRLDIFTSVLEDMIINLKTIENTI